MQDIYTKDLFKSYLKPEKKKMNQSKILGES